MYGVMDLTSNPILPSLSLSDIHAPWRLSPSPCSKTRKILIMHAWPRQDDAKVEISLQSIRVIRKHADHKKPGMEIIAGETGEKYYIYVKPEACAGCVGRNTTYIYQRQGFPFLISHASSACS